MKRPLDLLMLKQLNSYKHKLTRQQYKTLKGQILSGDATGAMRGLVDILRKKDESKELL